MGLKPDEIVLTQDRIDQTGLYCCVAQVDSIARKLISIWVVPKVD